MAKLLNKVKGDKAIWIVVLLLSFISMLAVYSSTGALAYSKQAGNTEYYFLRHFSYMIFGLLLMYLSHLVNYTFYGRFSKLAMYAVIPLLVYTIFSGSSYNEASRWVMIPILKLTIQPSDIAKIVSIVYLAFYLRKNQDILDDFKKGILPVAIVLAIVILLIFPANLSTAILMIATWAVMFFVSQVKIKHMLKLAGLTVLLMFTVSVVLMNVSKSSRVATWVNRVVNHSDTENVEKNYQKEQSKIAIASGYPLGKGPGKSTQRNFLPHPYSDFIFAIIIEEYGPIGGILILVLYMVLLYRGIRIAIRAPGSFGAYIAIGITFIIVLQAMINMAVAVGLGPVTGQPLPLVSMGGSSFWFTSISFGILLSVSKEIENEEEHSENQVRRTENRKTNIKKEDEDEQ